MVSVIVPAHNEEAYLADTLEALNQQDYRWFEVIVVCNGCSDATPEVARGKCNRLIVLSQKSLGVARNLGARMARGEIIVFLDADTRLEPNTLRRIAQEFTTDHAAGTLRGLPDNDLPQYKAIYALKNFVHRSSLHTGSSGVIVCWKKHFIRAGGFDERLEMRENSELIRRLMKFGRYKYIGTTAAVTSMRRYEQCGCRQMVLLWSRVWLQSIFGSLRDKHYETVR